MNTFRDISEEVDEEVSAAVATLNTGAQESFQRNCGVVENTVWYHHLYSFLLLYIQFIITTQTCFNIYIHRRLFSI